MFSAKNVELLPFITKAGVLVNYQALSHVHKRFLKQSLHISLHTGLHLDSHFFITDYLIDVFSEIFPKRK